MKKLAGILITSALLMIMGCAESSSGGDLFVNIGGYSDVDDNVIITWDDADSLSSDVDYYSIYQADSIDGSYEELSPSKSVAISSEAAELGSVLYDLDLGETYYFKLKAEKSYGDLDVEDPYSDAITVTMRKADIFPVITSCFAQPSDTEDKVCLRWYIEADPSYTDIDDLEIYRATGDGEFSFLYSPIDTATEHYDDTVVDGTTYTYKIRVTYEDTYSASTEEYYESEERTIAYSHTDADDVTIAEPTLTSISVDTDYSSYACSITYDCAKNNTSGEFGAELRFVNSSGESTMFTADGDNNFGNTNPVMVNIDSSFLDAGTYTLWTRVFVEYGGERTYSDYLYEYGIVIE
jgi:hypothetical protein